MAGALAELAGPSQKPQPCISAVGGPQAPQPLAIASHQSPGAIATSPPPSAPVLAQSQVLHEARAAQQAPGVAVDEQQVIHCEPHALLLPPPACLCRRCQRSRGLRSEGEWMAWTLSFNSGMTTCATSQLPGSLAGPVKLLTSFMLLIERWAFPPSLPVPLPLPTIPRFRHSPRHHQMLLALVSDTHGVFDPALTTHFAGADAILHAGDVGSHGGHAAVLARLREVCPAVHAVRGNVDDDAAARQDLPESLLLTLAGWRVLLIHILADAAAAIQRHLPDIVVYGHSHKYGVEEVPAPHGGLLLQVNPGSAGPARFKLSRTVALLTLPPKGAPGWVDPQAWCGLIRRKQPCPGVGFVLQHPFSLPICHVTESGERPGVKRVELVPKAPPRLPEACRLPRARQGKAPQAAHSRQRRQPSSVAAQGSKCKKPKLQAPKL